MVCTADKTRKSAPSTYQRTPGTTFFRKADEATIFGSKQNDPFFNTRVQAKLQVSTPDDPQEKEADAVADKVMRMPEQTAVFAPPGKDEKISRKEEEEVQAKQEAPQLNSIRAKENRKRNCRQNCIML